MTDWLDDLLSELPSDPQPPGLDLRVHARLHASRRRERWARGVLWLALAGAAAAGLWLVVPFLESLGVVMPHLNGAALGAWADLFAASPIMALNSASHSLLSWASRVGERLKPAMILALVLIAVSGLNAVARLIRDVERQEEAFA